MDGCSSAESGAVAVAVGDVAEAQPYAGPYPAKRSDDLLRGVGDQSDHLVARRKQLVVVVAMHCVASFPVILHPLDCGDTLCYHIDKIKSTLSYPETK